MIVYLPAWTQCAFRPIAPWGWGPILCQSYAMVWPCKIRLPYEAQLLLALLQVAKACAQHAQQRLQVKVGIVRGHRSAQNPPVMAERRSLDSVGHVDASQRPSKRVTRSSERRTTSPRPCFKLFSAHLDLLRTPLTQPRLRFCLQAPKWRLSLRGPHPMLRQKRGHLMPEFRCVLRRLRSRSCSGPAPDLRPCPGNHQTAGLHQCAAAQQRGDGCPGVDGLFACGASLN